MSYLEEDPPLAPRRRQTAVVSSTMIAPRMRGATVEIAQQGARTATASAGNDAFSTMMQDPEQSKNLIGTAVQRRMSELAGQIQRFGRSTMDRPEEKTAWENELKALQAGDHSSVANNPNYLRTIAAPYVNNSIALAPRVQQAQQTATDARMAGAQGVALAPYRADRANTDQTEAATNTLIPAQGRVLDSKAGLNNATANVLIPSQAARNTAEATTLIPSQAARNTAEAGRITTMTPLEAQKQQIANSLDEKLIAPRVAQAGADVQKTQIDNDVNTQLIAPRVRMAGAQAQQTEQLIAPAVRGANAQAGLAESQAEVLRRNGNQKPMTPADRAAAVKAATDDMGGINRDAVGYIESGQWPQENIQPAAEPTAPGFSERAQAANTAMQEVAAPNSIGNAVQYLAPAVPAARGVIAGARAFMNPNKPQAQQTAPKKITPEIARAFLTQAGGDRAKARQMATAAGYVF